MLLKTYILFAPGGEKNKALLVFLWIAYALVTASLTSSHVPWRDEAYQWLIAREVGWFDIYWEAGRNVSPSLWYYILAIPAKLGFPYWTMQFLHWLVACFAAWIFLFKAPFSTLFKAAFIFSYYIAYEHAAIARVYMPTLLMMWGVCSFYAQRYQRPVFYGVLVALLAHTSFFGILLATFFALDFILSRGRPQTRIQLGAMVIMFAAIFLGVFGIVPNKEALYYCSAVIDFVNWAKLKDVFYYSYFTLNWDHFFPQGIKSLLWLIGPWAGVLYGVLTLWLLRRWRAYGLLIFFVLSWLVIAYFAVFKYAWSSPRHYSFCLMNTIMILWLGKTRYRETKTMPEFLIGILLLGSLLLGILGTLNQGYLDRQRPYSGSKGMAEYLIDHKLDRKTFVAQNRLLVVSILPYMPRASLWDPVTLKTVRHNIFRGFSEKIPKVGKILS
ncbi:MAG: hypothetical protein HQL21_05255, partial [Candidatus Omnitrophica bacterium]|nr:hypothetical protein [Candidatus Omnitrophota bacterium]